MVALGAFRMRLQTEVHFEQVIPVEPKLAAWFQFEITASTCGRVENGRSSQIERLPAQHATRW